jgi:hypothetical protein
MSSKITNTWEADPGWDYYEIWQSLHSVKAKIEAGLTFIADKEKATKDTDQKLKEKLADALGKLEEVIDFDLTVPFE